MTFRRLYLVYALILSAVIISIAFNKGAMFREILRDGIRTTGKVTSLQREFPGGDSRIRVRIEWSAGGRSSTLVTKWKAGPHPQYSIGSTVDLIVHNGTAYFYDEATAVGGGWLLWVGWLFIVGAPALLFQWLGLFKERN
jgi:hypothetical protein